MASTITTDAVLLETATAVRAEHRHGALGIGTPEPRLSWRVVTDRPDWRQLACEVRVLRRATEERVRLETDSSVLIPWPFAPLSVRESVEVSVRVFGADGVSTDWSRGLRIEAGLLDPTSWNAAFIGTADPGDLAGPQPAFLLRRTFELRRPVAHARLYASALGVYEPYLNGSVVGDHVLDPGWSSYDHRLRYQTYDVTHMLRKGSNAIGAIVGDGWYRGRLGFGGGRRNIYGDRVGLIAQLEVEYDDGTLEQVVSDGRWRIATGPLLSSDLYDGETYDARLERHGWSHPDYDDEAWSEVALLDRDTSALVAPDGPPVRRTETLEPVCVTSTSSGARIYDFGQNIVGRVRLTVRGEASHSVTLRHAEVLEDEELCTWPLRTAKATDRYTLRGGGAETWEPRFTFHGFRYAELRTDGDVEIERVDAIVCHSDMERTGWFECSDPLVNRLHENVVWSMRGNFLDIPTDCPQRDERIGWTGDIQIFAPTACFLYDAAGFLTSWLADVAAEQRPDGRVPNFVPDPQRGVLLGKYPDDAPSAAWGDAAIVVPWVMYERYADTGILKRQYPSMQRWIGLVASLAGESRLWDTGFQYGDWLDPTAAPDRPEDAQTPPAIVATAYFARSTRLLARIAAVLGLSADERHYDTLADEIRAAFQAAYIEPSGRVRSDSPTAYALLISFGLERDAEQRRAAGRRLAELVRKNGYRVSTGFVGTPMICDALCLTGHVEAAYRLLLQQECPSWLYPVTRGATTIWERWDGILPDGTLNPGRMTSFNHYALGAVADWLHRTVGGLAPGEPGYKCLEVCPQPGGDLTWARTRLATRFGIAETSWRIDAGTFTLDLIVPANTTASVSLPGDETPIRVGSGTHRWSRPFRG